LVAVALTACSSDPRYPSGITVDPIVQTTAPPASVTTPGVVASAAPETTLNDAADVELGNQPALTVRNDLPGRPIDRRVLGTNLPAWLGPERLADPVVQRATVESGVSLLRMPGGSWSNAYDWLGCENGDEATCYWTWAARPTDFIDFMKATSLPGMWTVSINATAESAAAAVAFFNGSVDDTRPIGTDRNGVDWQTIGTWASLRAEHGNPDPVGIELWEVGNEVFGGKPHAGGSECADFGWEDVWTCDGADYVAGDGRHDGYLAIRAAMVAVDPEIEVGAVGVPDPESWSNWGSEVIDGAGENLDFYVVHQYGFDGSPDGEEALARPASLWPDVVDAARSELPPGVPIAVTEYNLVSFESGDTNQSMTRTMNALFVADTIGQLILEGVAVANQWNLANGTTSSGTDYGLISADDGSRFPQFTAMAMWGMTGDTLLEFEGAVEEGVRVYPTRRADGTVSILFLNLAADEAMFTLGIAGFGDGAEVTVTTARTDDLEAMELIEDPPTELTVEGGTVPVDLPAWSISLLEVGNG
jgi:hypothetical protein